LIQFVQPIWLWAGAGIVVPVIIHLWNSKQGKTLKVGSIAFLTENARSHSRSLQLSELLLLLLRCLLLIILAFILSKPLLQNQVDQARGKGWVLMERETVQETYFHFKPVVDSLLASGHAFHYFTKGFEEAKLEDAVKMKYDSIMPARESYWLLLKELNQRVPATLPVYLFTDNNAARFAGSRPEVSMDIKWQVYTSNDTASTWLEKAYETFTDSIRIITGHSNTTGVYYTYRDIPHMPFNEKFTVDTSTLTVCIYADRPGTDASYLKAAMDAIRDFTKRKTNTTVVNTPGDIPGKYDWLFWLSENTIPLPLLKSRVFAYAKGPVKNIHSGIVTGDVSASEELPVFKMITQINPGNDYAIWKNGYGETVLSKEKGKHSVFHFYSRFDPQWNGLVWSEQFPQIMYELVFNETNYAKGMQATGKMVVDEQQIQPKVVDDALLLPKAGLLQKMDLTKPFWVAAFILFLLERIVSFRKRRRELYA